MEDPLRSEEGGEAKGIQVFASLTDSKNDFPVAGHSLAYFYGLGEFLVIAPAGNETLDTESRINLVLSSITIAVNSTQWYRVAQYLERKSSALKLKFNFQSNHYSTLSTPNDNNNLMVQIHSSFVKYSSVNYRD